jgi:hypothetical protein
MEQEKKKVDDNDKQHNKGADSIEEQGTIKYCYNRSSEKKGERQTE